MCRGTGRAAPNAAQHALSDASESSLRFSGDPPPLPCYFTIFSLSPPPPSPSVSQIAKDECLSSKKKLAEKFPTAKLGVPAFNGAVGFSGKALLVFSTADDGHEVSTKGCGRFLRLRPFLRLPSSASPLRLAPHICSTLLSSDLLSTLVCSPLAPLPSLSSRLPCSQILTLPHPLVSSSSCSSITPKHDACGPRAQASAPLTVRRPQGAPPRVAPAGSVLGTRYTRRTPEASSRRFERRRSRRAART